MTSKTGGMSTYCPVSEDEVDPRMGSVVWFVRLVDHVGPRE